MFWLNVRSAFQVEGNRLVKLSDDFRRSKRNLLWAASVLCLYSFSNPENAGHYTITLLSDFSISQNFLTVVLSLVLAYNWMSYGRELRRVRHVASSAAAGLIEDDTRDRGEAVIEQFELIGEKLRENLVDWVEKLRQAISKITEVEAAEIEISDGLKECAQSLLEMEQDSVQVKQNVMAFLEATSMEPKLLKAAKLYEPQAESLSEKVFDVSGKISHLSHISKVRDRQPDLDKIHDYEEAALRAEKDLEAFRQELREKAQEFTNFATDLDGRDVKSHLFHDIALPNVVALAAAGSWLLLKVIPIVFQPLI